MSDGQKMGMTEVVDALRQKIINQEILPGSKLRETALAEEYDISRPRLREAFGILEERGLIERVHNQGAVVARLSADQAKSLFEVREVLEGLAVRLATQKAKPGTWDETREKFGDPMQEALNRNDLNYYVEHVQQFRQLSFQIADSAVLTQTLDILYDRSRVLIRRLVLVPGRAEVAMLQHRAIIDAMVAGDAARAEDLKRENLRSACEWFENYQSYLL